MPSQESYSDALLRVAEEVVAPGARRLASIGFPGDEAAELSALHTRNFM